MMKLDELKSKYAGLCDQLAALAQKAVDEGRGLTAEEKTQSETLKAQIGGLEETIALAEESGKKQAALDAPANEPYRPATVPAEPKDEKPFKVFGDFLRAVIRAEHPTNRVVDNRLVMNAPAGLNEGAPSEGGFLVQQDFVAELLKRTYATGVLASRCRRIPISTNANGLKINGIDESSRANGSRWGGIRGYWENEADEMTASKPKFRQMELNLRKLTGLCYATSEVLQDAAALEVVVRDGFAEEFGFKMDDAIVWGGGTGQPLGFMNSGSLIQVDKETGQDADTVVVQNIVKMWSRMWGRSRANAAWFINQDVEPQLYLMSLPVGTGGVPVYMPANGLSGSPYSTLFGRPIVPLEQCQTVGTVGDIVLADLSQYLLIDKGGVQAAASIHVRFLYDENTFRFIYRVDGQPIWDKPLTPFKGTSTQSPFVALASRD